MCKWFQVSDYVALSTNLQHKNTQSRIREQLLCNICRPFELSRNLKKGVFSQFETSTEVERKKSDHFINSPLYNTR